MNPEIRNEINRICDEYNYCDWIRHAALRCANKWEFPAWNATQTAGWAIIQAERDYHLPALPASAGD